MSSSKLAVFSLGRVSAMLSINASLVLRLVEELGITAELEIDNVPHYCAGDVNRLRSRVAGNATDDPQSP